MLMAFCIISYSQLNTISSATIWWDDQNNPYCELAIGPGLITSGYGACTIGPITIHDNRNCMAVSNTAPYLIIMFWPHCCNYNKKNLFYITVLFLMEWQNNDKLWVMFHISCFIHKNGSKLIPWPHFMCWTFMVLLKKHDKINILKTINLVYCWSSCVSYHMHEPR